VGRTDGEDNSRALSGEVVHLAMMESRGGRL